MRLPLERHHGCLTGIVTAVFSMVGAEIATIAGAELGDPPRPLAHPALRRGNSDGLAASPYVTAFEQLGIPHAADIMNAVVLTSVLSCLYAASRMLFVLTERREAPARVARTNGRVRPPR